MARVNISFLWLRKPEKYTARLAPDTLQCGNRGLQLSDEHLSGD